MKKNLRLVTGAMILLLAANTMFAQNSVLSSGDWYKIAVQNTGIHRITYDDLLDYGIDPSQINPKFIRLYGNGNGMLPESIDEFRFDDLQENSIFVFGEEDETFDLEDYILFYGEEPTEWNLNEVSGLFEHEVNLYSEFTYYFLNFDLGEGKRIQPQYSTIIPPTCTSTSFNDYFYHELELENLIHSGKEWYGDPFDGSTVYSFIINYPDLITSRPITLKSKVAARSSVHSNFNFDIDGQTALSINLPPSSSNANGDYAKTKWDSVSFYVEDSTWELSISYDKPTGSSQGWLDYFTFNLKRENIFEVGQLKFRDIESAEPGKVTTFQLTSPDGNFNIWNITDPLNPIQMDYTYSNGLAEFILETDSLLDFIAFDENLYFSPEYISEIENQNLHALEPFDMIIVTHDDFIVQAQQLADFRESNDGISTFVTTPEIIYNEFSSGVQDITAIRDFMKYLYDKSNGESPENLLLFGDASFDYKNITHPNTNFLPGWESEESLNPVGSYFSDDYFGEIDINTNYLAIGIGRLPVKTTQEANAIIGKIIHYSSSENAYGSWRNEICFIADDEDNNLHFNDAEKLAMIIDTSVQIFNISKIYLDAFEQQTTTNGQLYPQANQAITNRINEGINFLFYNGHGFYDGLAHEKIFTDEDIENWDNPNYYPLWLAATCDFGRIDDPEKYSLAEKAILLEGKGMSAIIAASRATYAGANYSFQKNFVKTLCAHPEYTIGEIIKLTKLQANGGANNRKISLLGDPSMRLAIPEYKIITEAINGVSTTEPMDTINPGEQINVTGFINDAAGQPYYNFNGSMEIRVFDRIDTVSTLGNDPQSIITDFLVRDSVLLTLNTEIINGQFDFSFNLPYTLDESYGTIKLSYYGMDYPLDARGEFSELVVGGPASAITKNEVIDDLISLYPTIVQSEIHCISKQKINDLQLVLFDLTGRKVNSISEQNIQAGKRSSMDISDLNHGLYIMRVNADNQISTIKIIKQ